jgi:prepilin-type N-terminal cleavage/methylation domain-containing protein
MKTLKTQPSPLTPLPRGEGNHPLKTKNSNLKTIIRTKLLPTPKTKNYLPKTHFLKTKDSNLKTLSAFTLVELIVVIVILAILATIAFLSFSSQSASARDSTRLSDMNNIAK